MRLMPPHCGRSHSENECGTDGLRKCYGRRSHSGRHLYGLQLDQHDHHRRDRRFRSHHFADHDNGRRHAGDDDDQCDQLHDSFDAQRGWLSTILVSVFRVYEIRERRKT